jgi:hypothetical protein
VALLLRRRGIERVRPLAGGFYAWRDRGYPLVGLTPVAGGGVAGGGVASGGVASGGVASGGVHA